MSHRKVNSQGSIPFSWESRPGIMKFLPNDRPVEETPPSVNDDTAPESPVCDPRIPLPQPPMRSTSYRAMFRPGQDDPFLAAYRECTRSGQNTVGSSPEGRYRENRGNGIRRKKGLLGRKGLSMFSCKSSCDVREDNFISMSDVKFS
ncbi:hypothetical protein MLD38_003319 [Melastoma candidum]|uniref:Uncharacterized protein n=1 Tax=Melastoma candidum TaxID=119954 RepID=A0ACB9S1Z2_9MYRT|nr:hypothetical protein MLD38_003319 [Melastoma candidum]